jgi:hypothetical protein
MDKIKQFFLFKKKTNLRDFIGWFTHTCNVFVQNLDEKNDK